MEAGEQPTAEYHSATFDSEYGSNTSAVSAAAAADEPGDVYGATYQAAVAAVGFWRSWRRRRRRRFQSATYDRFATGYDANGTAAAARPPSETGQSAASAAAEVVAATASDGRSDFRAANGQTGGCR